MPRKRKRQPVGRPAGNAARGPKRRCEEHDSVPMGRRIRLSPYNKLMDSGSLVFVPSSRTRTDRPVLFPSRPNLASVADRPAGHTDTRFLHVSPPPCGETRQSLITTPNRARQPGTLRVAIHSEGSPCARPRQCGRCLKSRHRRMAMAVAGRVRVLFSGMSTVPPVCYIGPAVAGPCVGVLGCWGDCPRPSVSAGRPLKTYGSPPKHGQWGSTALSASS